MNRIHSLSPLSIGIAVAALCFFGVAYVVAYATSNTDSLSTATQTGINSLQSAVNRSGSSSVSNAIDLPVFGQTELPTNPTVATVAVYESPQWLEVLIDENGKRVWADTWFDCRDVATGAIYYAGSNANLAIWLALPAIAQRDIKELCHE